MDQLTKLIAGLNLRQRISILAMALLAGAGVVTFVHWRHEGDFRPLYSSMAPEDAAAVVQKLKESGVEYRLADNGASVLVPSAKLAESRLALAGAGLPKSGRIGFELFDKNNFGATEFVEHINYQRALEGELERSVMSLAEVEEARVHLTLPKESVFLDQQEPAKASVMVKLRAGAQISAQNVAAVTNLVASAVQGLSPDAVSVVDMDGTLLSRPKRASAGDDSESTSEALEVRQQLEHSLVSKISATLEPLLGPNGFRAGASVDCDLTSGDQQEETFDPTHSVMTSSQKTEDATERASSGGIPGTASNVPQAAAPIRSAGGGVSRRTENITYETSRIVRHTRIPQGVIKRMSLAVLVDQTVQWEGQGAAKHRVLVPPAPETLKSIRDLVAGVTGFSADRGDQLIVETLPFESSLHAAPPANGPAVPAGPKGPRWLQFFTQYRDLLLTAMFGLAFLLAVGRGIVRMLAQPKGERRGAGTPGQIEAGGGGYAGTLAGMEGAAQIDGPGATRALAASLSEEDREQLAERVRQVAKHEPAVTANVVRMWLQDTES